MAWETYPCWHDMTCMVWVDMTWHDLFDMACLTWHGLTWHGMGWHHFQTKHLHVADLNPRHQCCQPLSKWETLQSLPSHSLVSDKIQVSNAIHHGQGLGRLNKGGMMSTDVTKELTSCKRKVTWWTRHGLAWQGMTWHIMERHESAWKGMTRHAMTRHDMRKHDMISV